MRPAAGLATLAAGAILAFAVTAKVPGLNLMIAGVIIMVAALAWLVMTSPAAAAWARGRGPLRARPPLAPEKGQGPAGPVADDDDVDYFQQDPAVLAADLLRAAGTTEGWLARETESWLAPGVSGTAPAEPTWPDGPLGPRPFGRG
jgi:hypothetical protein